MKNPLTIRLFKYNILFFVLFLFFAVEHADAAKVYFEPQPAIYQVGDSFTLSVVLDTEGQAINAVGINILVPKLLKIKRISKDQSIIQLWVNEPSFSGEAINLIGGIPGGMTTAKGTVAKITFEAVAIGSGNIGFMPSSSILLNDGEGTKLDLKMAGGPLFTVVPRPKEESKEEESSEGGGEKEQEKAKTDNEKPEKFQIIIGEDPRVFSGQKFISFFATDKDSGIDRYEVKEGADDYKIAQSPYLLSDSKLKTVIKVRAYDGADNYRESVYPGLLKRIWWWISHIVSFGII